MCPVERKESGSKTVRESAPNPFITKAERQKVTPADKRGMHLFYSSLAQYFPGIKKKLLMADLDPDPTKFMAKVFTYAILLTITLSILSLIILKMTENSLVWIVLIAPLLFAISFFYWMFYPDLKVKQREHEIDRELVFAGRHMLIELEAGVPMFDAMLGVTRDYGEVSKEFNKIVERITLGVPATLALHEVADSSPSNNFRRLILQMVNSLTSGSDLAAAMGAVLDQIAQEQVIQLKAYGQKLNPLAMFFMIFGVIMPSLGVAFAIIILSFLGGGEKSVGSSLLVIVFFLIIIVQFSFLSVIESSRPKIDIA